MKDKFIKIFNRLFIPVGGAILIIIIFFKDDLSKEIYNTLWISAGILLIVSIIVDRYKKNKKGKDEN